MSNFTGELKVELASTESVPQIKLLETLTWELGGLGTGIQVIVPKGFVCDGITVPRLFWSYIPPVGHPAVRAAVLHDYLIYLWREDKWEEQTILPLTKKQVDEQFKEALKACGVNKYMAMVLYGAVRLYSTVSGAG